MPFCEAMDKVITLPFHHRKTKYGNALAAHLQRRDLLHDRSLEEALLNAAIQAGFVDAKSGFGIPSVDGVSLEQNLSVVHLLKCLSEQAMSVE